MLENIDTDSTNCKPAFQMDITDLVIKGFPIVFGIGVLVAIGGWFIIDIRKRRKLGLPVLDKGSPSSMIILYQPDSIFRSRMSVDNLSNFIQLIQYKCLSVLLSPANRNFDLVVGIKPGKRTRAWIVPSTVPHNRMVFSEIIAELSAPSITGPVSFAIRIGQGSGEEIPIPEEWKKVIIGKGKDILIPDAIFEEIWPD